MAWEGGVTPRDVHIYHEPVIANTASYNHYKLLTMVLHFHQQHKRQYCVVEDRPLPSLRLAPEKSGIYQCVILATTDVIP